MTTSAIKAMEEVVPRLCASSPEPLSFDPDAHIRAFLLEREQGNILVYSNGALQEDAAAVAERGGVDRQYLNHWHEAMFGAGSAGETFGAPLLCHVDDAAEVRKRAELGSAFSARHHLDDDFEAIPIPGHTPGATAYLWDSGEHRALFTGDSIYLRDGEWVAAVLDSSDRGSYIASLELLGELDFDLLVPWAASAGRLPYAATDRADAGRRLAAIIDRLRAGDDH